MEEDNPANRDQTAAIDNSVDESGVCIEDKRKIVGVESADTHFRPKPHCVIYIKNDKTGEWEVKNPAGSYAYNYLSRDEFPDE